jgi:hypothetical protein
MCCLSVLHCRFDTGSASNGLVSAVLDSAMPLIIP